MGMLDAENANRSTPSKGTGSTGVSSGRSGSVSGVSGNTSGGSSIGGSRSSPSSPSSGSRDSGGAGPGRGTSPGGPSISGGDRAGSSGSADGRGSQRDYGGSPGSSSAGPGRGTSSGGATVGSGPTGAGPGRGSSIGGPSISSGGLYSSAGVTPSFRSSEIASMAAYDNMAKATAATQRATDLAAKNRAAEIASMASMWGYADLANYNLPNSLEQQTARAALQSGIRATAVALGIDPVDLATAISYETAGTFSPTKTGPTTKWGEHKGLIQFGGPQAATHGIDWSAPAETQLGPDGAIASYLKDAGVVPGTDFRDIYSAINAGGVGKYGNSDEAAGGMPGTVQDKVDSADMAAHRAKAENFMSGRPASQVANTGSFPETTNAIPTTRASFGEKFLGDTLPGVPSNGLPARSDVVPTSRPVSTPSRAPVPTSRPQSPSEAAYAAMEVERAKAFSSRPSPEEAPEVSMNWNGIGGMLGGWQQPNELTNDWGLANVGNLASVRSLVANSLPAGRVKDDKAYPTSVRTKDDGAAPRSFSDKYLSAPSDDRLPPSIEARAAELRADAARYAAFEATRANAMTTPRTTVAGRPDAPIGSLPAARHQPTVAGRPDTPPGVGVGSMPAARPTAYPTSVRTKDDAAYRSITMSPNSLDRTKDDSFSRTYPNSADRTKDDAVSRSISMSPNSLDRTKDDVVSRSVSMSPNSLDRTKDDVVSRSVTMSPNSLDRTKDDAFAPSLSGPPTSIPGSPNVSSLERALGSRAELEYAKDIDMGPGNYAPATSTPADDVETQVPPGYETETPAIPSTTPNRSRSPAPAKDAQQEVDSFGEKFLGTGLDVLGGLIPGPVGMGISVANVGLMVTGNKTIGQQLADAIFSGDNQYQPGSTPQREGNDRRKRPSTSRFASKYLRPAGVEEDGEADQPSEDTPWLEVDGRPTPKQKWVDARDVYAG